MTCYINDTLEPHAYMNPKQVENRIKIIIIIIIHITYYIPALIIKAQELWIQKSLKIIWKETQ